MNLVWSLKKEFNELRIANILSGRYYTNIIFFNVKCHLKIGISLFYKPREHSNDIYWVLTICKALCKVEWIMDKNRVIPALQEITI